MTGSVPDRPDRFDARRAVEVPPPVERVRTTVLPGGLRIVTDTNEQARSATLATWVAVGGRDEPDHLSGASHFLEHLLFKGTETRDARSIARAVDGVGGDMNAYTANEHTVYYARVPAGTVDLATDLLLDVVASPALRPEELEGERGVILEELAAVEDDPEDLVAIRLFEGLFPDHPLGREVLGTTTTIAGLDRAAVAGFFDDWYTPVNLVVVATGLVDHDALTEAVAARFGDRRVGAVPVRTPPVAPVLARQVEERPVELVHLALGWRGLAAADPDRFPLAVLNQVLGAGPSSRLFQEVREERGLTYGISSSVGHHVDTGAVTVQCAATAGNAGQVLDLVRQEVARLVAEGPTEEEVDLARGALRGGLLMAMEDGATRMVRLGTAMTMRGGVLPVADHLARIDAVTVDDVARVARDVLGGPEVLAAVGPRGTARRLAD